jgi:hypothetical protein
VTLEETFAKVVGRPASDAERQRLHRLRDALGVQDNDALWAIVMALELYDSFYRRYPEQLAAETSKAIEGARQAFAAAAAAEAAKASAVLSKQVARSSVALATKMAGRSIALPWVAAAGAALVAFGAICLSAGATLGAGARPVWAGRSRGGLGVLGVVLGAPAGWMIFAMLLPAAGYGVWSGWRLARGDGEDAERWLGWAAIAASVLGALGCVVMLLEVL